MITVAAPQYGDDPRKGASGAGLSIIVQGPCERMSSTRPSPSIDEVLASLRAVFPKAQLIVSTWLGSDVQGLDADDILLNTDPGPLEHPLQRPNNVNRMVLSTANGLKLANQPFCIKTRSDVVFRSDSLIHRELSLAADNLSIQRRIWIASIGTARIDTYLRPFHAGDMIQYGLTEDLRRLWNIPNFSWNEVFLPDLNMALPRMCPEQAVFVSYLRSNNIDVDLEMTIDGRPEIIATAIDSMLGAFDVFDEETDDIVFPPRLRAAKLAHLVETPFSFEALRTAWHQDRTATYARLYNAFHERKNLLLSGRVSITQDPAAYKPEIASAEAM